MATYISLLNYTDQGIRNVKDSPKRLDAARKLLKDLGGDLKEFYLTMGGHDMVVVADAPSDEVMAKFSLTVGSLGSVRTPRSRRSRRPSTGRSLQRFPRGVYLWPPSCAQRHSRRRARGGPIGGKIVNIGKDAILKDFAVMLEWFDRVGYSADIPANAKAFGIRPTTLEEWATLQNWG